MDELIKLFNALMSGSLPTRTIETAHYIITVSADSQKVKMEDRRTHEVFTIKDFNDREISLLACISKLEEL